MGPEQKYVNSWTRGFRLLRLLNYSTCPVAQIKNKIEINFKLEFIDKKPNANPIILRQQNDNSLFIL